MNTNTRVYFSYAFSTPHRLTVGLPDSSDRTLLDLYPGRLRLAWTYETLVGYPLAAFATPVTAWEVNVTLEIDDQAISESEWRRAEGWLPAVVMSVQTPVAGSHSQVSS